MKEKASIEKVYTRTKKTTMPTLLKFQNGKLAAFTRQNTLFTRMSTKVSTGALMVANGQIYHGLSGSTESELTDSYICVRNKTTNKVRIIPIEQVRLNNHIYNKLEETRLKQITKDDTNTMLLKQFGGRKASRYQSNKEKMQVDVDVVKDDLENTVRDATFAEDQDEQAEANAHYECIRPKYNKDATAPNEVYDVNDVVPEELLDRLEEEAKTVFATKVDKLPITSDYLRNCIATLQALLPSAENFLKIKLIIYMDALLNMTKTRDRYLKKTELSGITEKVENDVRVRFSDSSSKPFLRTALTAEKAFCHFIVLALLIDDNYQADLKVLTQELCAPRQKVSRLAHIVWARPKPYSDQLFLRIPSTVPPLPSKTGKKKKK